MSGGTQDLQQMGRAQPEPISTRGRAGRVQGVAFTAKGLRPFAMIEVSGRLFADDVGIDQAQGHGGGVLHAADDDVALDVGHQTERQQLLAQEPVE